VHFGISSDSFEDTSYTVVIRLNQSAVLSSSAFMPRRVLLEIRIPGCGGRDAHVPAIQLLCCTKYCTCISATLSLRSGQHFYSRPRPNCANTIIHNMQLRGVSVFVMSEMHFSQGLNPSFHFQLILFQIRHLGFRTPSTPFHCKRSLLC
jgi:hypothetical protein